MAYFLVGVQIPDGRWRSHVCAALPTNPAGTEDVLKGVVPVFTYVEAYDGVRAVDAARLAKQLKTGGRAAFLRAAQRLRLCMRGGTYHERC